MGFPASLMTMTLPSILVLVPTDISEQKSRTSKFNLTVAFCDYRVCHCCSTMLVIVYCSQFVSCSFSRKEKEPRIDSQKYRNSVSTASLIWSNETQTSLEVLEDSVSNSVNRDFHCSHTAVLHYMNEVRGWIKSKLHSFMWLQDELCCYTSSFAAEGICSFCLGWHLWR